MREATVAVQQELGAVGHCTPDNKKQAKEARAIHTQRMFLPTGKSGLLTSITLSRKSLTCILRGSSPSKPSGEVNHHKEPKLSMLSHSTFSK